ncbi:hypothetical protein [Hyphococcus sp.]|uniref:hypothetical protein n=1 Tax=Hyphococcus sp. TaxID=2038636 RepID=UPI0035C68112
MTDTTAIEELEDVPDALLNVRERLEKATRIIHEYSSEIRKLKSQNRPTDGAQATLFLDRIPTS